MSTIAFDIDVLFDSRNYHFHVKKVPEPDEEKRYRISDDFRIVGDIWQSKQGWKSDRIRGDTFVKVLGYEILKMMGQPYKV